MRWRDLLQLQAEQPLPDDFFETPRRVHFIGAGGIGMSALALLLQARGHDVSGSDESDGAIPQKLREAGVAITIGHDAENVAGAEAIFYSSAIGRGNPEWIAGEAAEIPSYHRSQLMAHISNAAKVSIAVSGTHGKSTTSAMIAHILTETGHNPTAILGAVYPPFESNLRIGDPDLVVVEADESDGSFTLLKPTVAVVLNVEPEHLENYDESEDELWKAFEMFADDNSEHCLWNANQEGLPYKLFNKLGFMPGLGFDFGIEDGVMQAKNIEFGQGRVDFKVEFSTDSGETFLSVPGTHNVSNATSAILACAFITDTPFQKILSAVSTFAGTLRRFERKGEASGVLVYDDYGHHPTEVKATLGAAKEFLARPIAVVFQPHRYSRTQALYRDFGKSFGDADCIIITQLYSAHEEPIEGVSGRMVFDEVRANYPDKPVFYAEDLDEALSLVLQNVKTGDALLTMGAGTITTLGPRVLESLA